MRKRVLISCVLSVVVFSICFYYTQQADIWKLPWEAKRVDNAKAEFLLGTYYYVGAGVEKDFAEAVKWYRKAAEQGHAPAQYELGKCYEKGEGVEQDYTEAFKWFYKAAEQGYIPALNYLGFCYAEGKGVTQDDTESEKWYRRATEQLTKEQEKLKKMRRNRMR